MSYVIGIDLGGMSAKAGIFDEEGILLNFDRSETSAKDSPETTAANLADLAERLIKNAAIPQEKVAAIGIGSPGIIDSKNGVVVRWTNFGWKNVPLAQLIQSKIGIPVYVTNDANAAALGEAKHGGGKGYSDSVLITLGTGVGGGIIMNGQLVEGYGSAGGELGHMVIRRDGLPCTCGRRGCLESYASATALKSETRKMMEKFPDSLMWEGIKGHQDISGKTAFDAARRGDKAAQRVVSEYVKNLGEGVINIVNLLRPQVVILGGGVSNEGDNLINPLKQYVFKRIYAPISYVPFDIVKATLGNDAGIYGAAEYAKNR